MWHSKQQRTHAKICLVETHTPSLLLKNVYADVNAQISQKDAVIFLFSNLSLFHMYSAWGCASQNSTNASITHMKLAAGWAFIGVNFEPTYTQQMLCSFIFT